MNESLESISYNNNEANATNLNITYLAEQNVTTKILLETLQWFAETEQTNLNETYLAEQNVVSEISPYLPQLVIYTFYIIIGTTGNSMVCLAILLDRNLQTYTNYFLLSLAVTDLLICIFNLPAKVALIVGYISPEWLSLYWFWTIYLITGSAIHICFISVARYVAIKNPLKQRTLAGNRVAIRIGLVWLIAFSVTIPRMVMVFGKSEYDYIDTIDNIVIGGAFTIMVVIIIASLLMTSVVLHQLIKEQKENKQRSDTGFARTVGGKKGDGKAAEALQSEQKAFKVIWLVSIAFMICLAPVSFVMIYINNVGKEIPKFFEHLTECLFYANSIVNPIIYTIFNKRFRNNFKNYILCKYKKI